MCWVDCGCGWMEMDYGYCGVVFFCWSWNNGSSVVFFFVDDWLVVGGYWSGICFYDCFGVYGGSCICE